ncbi:MAG TPA: Dabb family protein [Planctomycetota bacterium]|nr:Dabb family protein [Planctomycetota bacterium]
MFIHTVYFWFNEGTPEAARKQLVEDCYKYLKAIPTVRQIYAGPPAMTPREVVDNSYQVGLTVILDDSPGHDVYQKHELHMDFIVRNKAHWKRVQVYDFFA